jgi:hypothetical protein
MADSSTLLLIDEFGGGTEPTIGGAMAEAILLRFTQKSAFGVITTHYQNLKHFADAHNGVVNGAMLYDRHQMQALFQLQIGNPGSSFAIEIARKIGIPEDVITDATNLVGKDYVNADKYLLDIVRDKRYWEGKRQTIHSQEKQMEQTIQRYEREIEEKTPLIPWNEVNKKVKNLDFSHIEKPRHMGLFIYDDIDTEDIKHHIDWTMFFNQWGIKGRYPDIFSHSEKGEEARRLYEDAVRVYDDMACLPCAPVPPGDKFAVPHDGASNGFVQRQVEIGLFFLILFCIAGTVCIICHIERVGYIFVKTIQFNICDIKNMRMENEILLLIYDAGEGQTGTDDFS